MTFLQALLGDLPPVSALPDGVVTALISSATAVVVLYLGHRFNLIASAEERRAIRKQKTDEKNIDLRIREVDIQESLRNELRSDNQRLNMENRELRQELEESAKLRRKLGEALEQASRDRLKWEEERLGWYEKERTWDRLVTQFHTEREEWHREREEFHAEREQWQREHEERTQALLAMQARVEQLEKILERRNRERGERAG